MQLAQRLAGLRQCLQPHYHLLDYTPATPGCVLFCSISDGKKQAVVFHVTGHDFDAAWSKVLNRIPVTTKKHALRGEWLRIDMVQHVRMMPWEDFVRMLHTYRRNYFRYGITFDAAFTYPLLEQECCANAILYGLNKQETAEFSEAQFLSYTRRRFAKDVPLPSTKDGMVGVFGTTGAYCGKDGFVYRIPGVEDSDNLPLNDGAQADAGPTSALYAGRRYVPEYSRELLDEAISTSSRYLAGQMTDSGEFHYGYLPGLGKRLTSYNRVRHAGTLFALLDTLEYNKDETLRPVIDAGVHYLAGVIQQYSLPDREDTAFLVEANGEIKLGGNGVSLVTLSRWTKLTGRKEYIPLMEQMGAGIVSMQNQDTGTFVHILDGTDLSVRSAYRTVYYDGEALFGLMQLYDVTGNIRWLHAAQKAFDAFIDLQHWKHHDHWLGYAANEITVHAPEERYFSFGMKNAMNHVNFIMKRETTYPTLLELCMAAERMLRRMERLPHLQHLLQGADLDRFRLATQRRAEYLFNGYMWPEVVMYFQRPYQILGSFFIRHHAFRVRIDDVGHYLCGLVGYADLFGRQSGASR